MRNPSPIPSYGFMVNRASSPTRDETWPVLFIQQEQFRIGPYIARIEGDKERQIANQAQASAVGMFLEALRPPMIRTFTRPEP